MIVRSVIVLVFASLSTLAWAQASLEGSSSSKTQIAMVFGEAASLSTPGTAAPTVIEPVVQPVRFASCEESVEKNACRFQWGPALRQATQFLAIQHVLNSSTYQGTLEGPFFKDWMRSLKHYRYSRFQDDDPYIVDYVGHPMMGAVTSWIQIQNDPRGRKQKVGWKKAYWKSRAKALAFSAVYSTQWELGPFSETSIGNLGSFKYYSKSAKHMTNGTGFTDLLITPTAGVTWAIGEDLIDQYVVQRLERRSRNVFYQAGISMLNPTRSVANLLRWKTPWYRDTRDRE